MLNIAQLARNLASFRMTYHNNSKMPRLVRRIYRFCVFFLWGFILMGLVALVTLLGPRGRFNINASLAKPRLISYADISSNRTSFNIKNEDMMVLLHIQKTGGTTFEKHLVHDLIVPFPCICYDERRRCRCPKQHRKPKTAGESTWLISRFSTGWICGLHADFEELYDCLRNSDRLFFMTFLRDPVHRYLSEYRHVKRGATWKLSRQRCRNFDAQSCYAGKNDWSNVSLSEFIDCEYNLANNRQTRMLADDGAIDCTTLSGSQTNWRQRKMLASAKKNLRSLAFFGICEQQKLSQYLFESTMKLTFRQDFSQATDNKTAELLESIDVPTRKKILDLNQLDIELYTFAKEVFHQRVHELDQ